MNRYEDLYSSKNKVIEYLITGSNFGDSNFDRWRTDREVVLMAVINNGTAFQYASPELRNDREFALKVISESGYCLKHVSEELSEDKGFIIEAVKLDSENLIFVSQKFKDDKEVVVEALKQDEGAIFYASQRLRDFANECGTVKAIEASLLSEQLQKSLSINSQPSKSTKRLKI